MAISKKSLRKIIVRDEEFNYKISKIKVKSDWREQNNELDDRFMKYASYYGLGSVKDITINIVVQSKKNPLSKMLVKINTILVDGFMGPEQLTQVKPKLVSKLICKALDDDWNPFQKGDYKLNLIETRNKEKKPIILQFPDLPENIEDYQNIEKPIEIIINHKN